MDVKSVIDARKFSAEKLAKIALYESERLACDVYGVEPGQEQKPHTHPACDKIYYVVEGCGTFRVGGEVREVGEKNVVYVPAGIEHSVKNDSPAKLTLLVFVSPHPAYAARSETRPSPRA
ncbi:MAG TPA: cupin domain-containing protein [Planctomycetota bacterium]|jgi:quercetin dioxygenase-like cupin family protein|nr:cupin domain-containing protein [Planctomycetota bacterium]